MFIGYEGEYTIQFLFRPDCLYPYRTCTELSGHWRLFVLVSSFSYFSGYVCFIVNVELFFRIVSYLTIVLRSCSCYDPARRSRCVL